MVETFVLLWSAAIAINSASAEVIVSQTGQEAYGFTLGEPDQRLVASWSSSQTFTNVAISVLLGEFEGQSGTGRAYLTSQIGPGTTTTQEIARTDFAFPDPEADVSLFSGLTLAPGTFYLTLIGSGLSGPTWGGCGGATTPIVMTAPGVVHNPDMNTTSSFPEYPPSSNFAVSSLNLIYTVTGQPVPEPSTLVLLATGAFGLLAYAWRRRRQAA
jgi:hypothetical protein